MNKLVAWLSETPIYKLLLVFMYIPISCALVAGYVLSYATGLQAPLVDLFRILGAWTIGFLLFMTVVYMLGGALAATFGRKN